MSQQQSKIPYSIVITEMCSGNREPDYEGFVECESEAIDLFVKKVTEVIDSYGFVESIDFYEFDANSVVREFMRWLQDAYEGVYCDDEMQFKPCMRLAVGNRTIDAQELSGVIGQALINSHSDYECHATEVQ
jgi:hypothetical protein